MKHPPRFLAQSARHRLLAVALGLACALAPLPLTAATILWGDTATNFNANASWQGGTAPANNLTSDIGSFADTSPSNQPRLSASRQINGLSFVNGTGAWTFTGTSGGSTEILTLGSGGILSNDDSTQTFSSNMGIALGANATFTSNSTGALNFSSNLASFNIGSFTLTLDGSSTNASNVIAEAIAGSGSLIKNGTGTWSLTGTNTFTGGVTINGGTLSTSNGASIDNAATVTINGAGSIWRINTSETVGNIAGDGQIVFAANRTLTVGSAANSTYSGVISDGSSTGNLVKTGSGTLTLSGASSFGGTTTISQGTLQLNGNAPSGANGALGNATSAITVNNGSTGANNTGLVIGASGVSVNRNITVTNNGTGTVTLGGNMASGTGTFTGNVTLNRSVNLQAQGTSTVTFSTGVISGAGAVTKTGSGTVALTGTNSYTGITTINAGTLSVSNLANGSSNSAIGASSNAAGNLVINGGTLAYTGSGHSSNRLFTLGTAGGTLDASGSGALNLTNTGSIVLSGTNTARTLTLTGTNTGSNTLTAVLGDNGSGATSLVKDGTGTWVLAGANTYTGNTSINAGTLRLGAANRLADSTAVTVASGATFALNNFNETVGSIAGAGSITLGTGTLATASNTSTAFSGAISGTGGLTKGGTGTLTLTGTNSYSGATSVSAGTLLVGGNNAIGASTGNVTVSAGATLALGAGVNVTRSGLLTLNGTGTSADTGALHAAGGTGTTSQWTGSITVNTAATVTAADNLLIIGNGATGQFNTTTLTLNDDITFHTPDAATVVPTYLPAPSYVLDPSNIVINSRIVGTGDLYKTGDGTLSIIRGTSTPNTFSGNTYVQGGKLIVEGPSNQAHLSSPNIFVGNLGSSNNDTVVLQSGQATGAAPGNNMIGVYDSLTNASTSSLTIYEDGLFNMNRSSNGFVNLTLHGGHVDGVGLNPLLTISGDLLAKASAQTALIENLNLGIGSNNLTLDAEAGTTSSGVDLLVSARIQQGVGFTALASGTSLEKTGEGKVVFSGANTYGGVTQVSNGVLNIQNTTALGQNSGTLGSTNHGTVVTGDGQLQIEGGLTVANETLTLAGAGNDGNGALRSVSGNNTLNGFVYLSDNARIEADSGSLLTIANPNGVNASILNGTAANKALTVGGAGDVTINGGIGNNINSITKQEAGTLTLAGNNSYAGATTVSGGAVKVTHSNGLSGSGVTVANGAALQFAQNASNQNITAVGVGATIQGNGLSNGGAIQNLNGDNTYLGNITLANNARITADSGSSLTLSGSVTGAGYTLNTGGAGNTTYSGVISGSGTAINKTDTGTVTLGGTSANTYTGATTVANGTLELNKTAGVTAVSSTTVNIGDGSGSAGSATLLLSQSNQINDSAALNFASDGRLNLNGKTETVGSVAGDGSIVFGTGQLSLGANNSSSTFSGTLAGDSAAILSKNGSGTLTFDSNVNAAPGDFAGSINVNAGTLAFNADNAFTGTFNIYAGTTLKLTDVDLSITNLNFLGSGAITLDFSGASTLSVTNLSLAAGVTVNVINWANAVDYFFAQNWIGATQDLTGTTPMNQIVFAGGSPAWTGNNTIWQSYDDQITPVPEPSTYGAMLIGAMGALLGYRRWRKQRSAPKA